MKPWWQAIGRFARPEARGLATVTLLGLLGSLVELLRPWPLKLLVDNVLPGRALPDGAGWIAALPGTATPLGVLGWLVAGTVALFLIGQAVVVFQGYVRAGVANRLTYGLATELFDALQRRSPIFHSRHRAGDLVKRVTTDSACVRKLMMDVVLPAVASAASLMMMFAVMWQLDRMLTVIALAAAPLLFVMIRLFTGPMTERSYREHQLQGEMSAQAEQTLTALPVVQSFGRAPHEEARFRKLSRSTLRASLESLKAQLQFKVGTGTVTAGCTAALMFIGGLHVLDGTLSIGSLIVFLAYLSSLYAPLESLAYLSASAAVAAAGARRVLEVLDEGEEVREVPGAQPPPEPARGVMGLEGVTVGYEPGRPVLKDVSLQLRPGETVALVGPTGAGKSTLAALVPRLLDPWEGRVTLDGADLKGLTLSGVRSRVAVVLQEPFLLPLSVAENIAYGRQEATRQEVEAAAVAADADEFIQRLPKGYDTVIGERGATLSGGQRQRLAIARALLKDAPVLVLDEPTSALDARTEAGVLEALSRLSAGRATLVVAHRFSTVLRADRVVVLDGGRIVQEGTHAELLRQSGLYRELFARKHSHQTVAESVAMSANIEGAS